ncbi:MAG: phage major capsid protein [Proteobacteria bacterium]|nr:phage major capsid protein [Pseudomonadota bacterium]
MTVTPETFGAPETKMRDTPHDGRLLEAFEAFKQANDARLSEIERKASADVLLEEKVNRLNSAMDAMIAKASRPAISGAEPQDFRTVEHKSAFTTYMRTGEANALRMLEAKALNGAVAPDSGYLLPVDAEAAILARLAALSPMRQVAMVRPLASVMLRKAVYPLGANAGWSNQTAPSNTVTGNQYAEMNFPTMELFAQPAATQGMLDDAAVDVEGWIADEVCYSFAQAESTAYISGDGTNRPKGLLTYPTVADASWTWGSLGTIATGVSANFPASNPSDILLDFCHALKTEYRQNAAFLMNRKTQGVIRKFKDTTGNYLWAPPSVVGAKATLMGFPLIEAEDMPDIGANSLSIAFGDFRRGYLIVDRVGIRALRDPFSAKPYVLFYTTKRVGGGVQDFEAIKLLKFGV